MKIILITNIPNPYRIPLFNTLSEEYRNREDSFTVLFGAKTYKRRKFHLDLSACNFDYRILQSKKMKLTKSEGFVFTYPGIIRYILKNRPDRVIVSGFSLATVKIFLISLFFPIRYIIWSGAVEGRFQSTITKIQRKILVRKAAGFIAYGAKAKTYLERLGANRKNIHLAINTVDTEYFKAQTNLLRGNIEKPPYPILTYVGYINARKDIGKLVEIAAELRKILKFKMLIVGDGEEREILEQRVAAYTLNEFVEFTGFKQKEEIPHYLAQTDLFLFQTGFDIWGLVLNEAMAAGCPCLASNKAGASYDLIVDGHNGFLCNFNDIKKCVYHIVDIIKQPALLRKIGENARVFIEDNASLRVSAEGFIKAVNQPKKFL